MISFRSRMLFGPTFIDIDERRDDPVRYRYVHDGLEGIRTRFSFYMPHTEWYEGRFIRFLEGARGYRGRCDRPDEIGRRRYRPRCACGARENSRFGARVHSRISITADLRCAS
jgi:hypothetical protein